MMNSFWNGKRVFVTGHTGFKGTWLCHWLYELGAEVSGYALEPPTQPSIFKLSNLGSRVHSTLGDIRDADKVAAAITQAQPEIVLHLAAQPLVLESYDDPVGTYMTNVIGTANVFEAIRKSGSVKAVVNVTTDKCYENREWHWGYREHEAMGGYDPYSSSKGCSELLTASYQRSFFNNEGINLASGRAGNVIGGGDWAEFRLVPDIVTALGKGDTVVIRNPHSIRPWQHVLEPISGYLKLAQCLYDDNGKDYVSGWNFGPHDSDAQPVNWIADRLCEKWGGSAKWELYDSESIPPHEAKYLKLDVSKARAELGWEPQLNLDAALDWIVEWHQAYEAKEDLCVMTLAQINKYQSLVEQGANY